jgi:hypothetical protein
MCARPATCFVHHNRRFDHFVENKLTVIDRHWLKTNDAQCRANSTFSTQIRDQLFKTGSEHDPTGASLGDRLYVLPVLERVQQLHVILDAPGHCRRDSPTLPFGFCIPQIPQLFTITISMPYLHREMTSGSKEVLIR